MLLSMTGYGHGVAERALYEVITEVSSVNSRHLEIHVRTPKEWLYLEHGLRAESSRHIHRGRVTIHMQINHSLYKPENIKNLTESLKKSIKKFQNIQKSTGLTGTLSIIDVLEHRDLFGLDRISMSPGAVEKLVAKALEKALHRYNMMRAKEGRHILAELNRFLAQIKRELREIEKQKKRVSLILKKKVEEKIKRLFKEIPVSQDRIYAETALLIEKQDISEEVLRLESHITQMKGFFQSRESVGRSMDFLVQEMFREINTIGSKANDSKISKHVVLIKALLEKSREQIQNIE